MTAALQLLPGSLLPGYILSGMVAGGVGAADILTRYKDNPWNALKTPAALLYIAANFLFGVAALWFGVVFDFGGLGKPAPGALDGLTVELVRDALVAGFGSIVILRAVAFKLPIGGGNKETDVGPSTIVDALLKACDQQIDRTQAARKDRFIRVMMADVSFDKAKGFIPIYCLALLQQDEDRATRLGTLISGIANLQGLDGNADSQKAYLLGNTLVNVFGFEVAARVITGFRTQLAIPPAAPAPPPAPPAVRPAPRPPPEHQADGAAQEAPQAPPRPN